jgi:hypothetical protein
LFSTPCLVFGNGNLPGKDILKIKYQSDEGSENELADKGGAQKDEKKDNGRKLSETGFTWECTEFTENGLKFKMEFSNPLKVSKNGSGAPDKLKISLKKNTFFSKNTFKELQGELTL